MYFPSLRYLFCSLQYILPCFTRWSTRLAALPTPALQGNILFNCLLIVLENLVPSFWSPRFAYPPVAVMGLSRPPMGRDDANYAMYQYLPRCFRIKIKTDDLGAKKRGPDDQSIKFCISGFIPYIWKPSYSGRVLVFVFCSRMSFLIDIRGCAGHGGT